MKLPIQITFHDIDHSDALEQQIRERAEKLNQYYDRITSCRVVVEMPQRRQHQGRLFNVRIDLTVPGTELVVNKHPNQDVYVAVRDAFDNAGRLLEDYARQRRAES